MRSKILIVALCLWALTATALAWYEHGVAKQMLSLAETEYDRRVVEEQFFEQFLDIKHVVIDPHTSPFDDTVCDLGNGQIIHQCHPTPDGKGMEGVGTVPFEGAPKHGR